MKKFSVFLCLISLVFGGAGVAFATPFQVGDTGSLVLDPIVSSIDFYYEARALETDEFELAQGETSDHLDFFELTVYSGDAIGFVDATVELVLPTLTGGGMGGFAVDGSLSTIDGIVRWGAPETFSYGDVMEGFFLWLLTM